MNANSPIIYKTQAIVKVTDRSTSINDSAELIGWARRLRHPRPTGFGGNLVV